jgi:hypothetical protein
MLILLAGVVAAGWELDACQGHIQFVQESSASEK